MQNLNILKGNLDIVFVALNPTKEALGNGAVFSVDRGFWNILEDAGITNSTQHVPLNDLAKEVFEEHKHSKLKLGFADLLPHIDEKESRNVKVGIGYARALAEQLVHHKTKRVALMGQKVVDAFTKEFPNLKKWKNLPMVGNKKVFGCIGTITINGHEMEIFAMPFPVNNNIPNKADDFKKLLQRCSERNLESRHKLGK